MADRAGAPPRAWQRMLSGRRLDLLDPSPLDVEIEDIAHGLARVARWNGQTKGEHAFSVAQHSLLVEALFAQIAPEATASDRLTTLLHDAPEYVIGDMISPFKRVMGGDYKAVEDRLQRAIHLRFSLVPQTPDGLQKAIKRADMMSAYHEATRLAGFTVREAESLFGRPRQPLPDEALIVPMATAAAQSAFLARFGKLHTAIEQAA